MFFVLTAEQIAAYLARINYTGPADPCGDTLRRLHIRQAMSVPFENLDSMFGLPVSLAGEDLYRKIVVNRRGGYCYELNSLFGLLLRSLGFTVVDLMGRVFAGPIFARLHHLLLVEADGRQWIADVGFGGNGLLAPLPLGGGIEELQFTDSFRLAQIDVTQYLLQHNSPGDAEYLYQFTLEPCLPDDYIIANYYNSTADTLFTTRRICTLPTVTGRRTLLDNELTVRDGDRTTTRILTGDDEEYRQVLAEYFGIELDALPWKRT